MKNVISIPLALLILFTGINVQIASHYCGGNFAAAKVSLTGKTGFMRHGRFSQRKTLSRIYFPDIAVMMSSLQFP